MNDTAEPSPRVISELIDQPHNKYSLALLQSQERSQRQKLLEELLKDDAPPSSYPLSLLPAELAPTRLVTALAQQDITRLGELASITEREFLAIKNLSRHTLLKARTLLHHFGLQFQEKSSFMQIRQRGTFRYNKKGSHCPKSDHNFAFAVAKQIYHATKNYDGGPIELEYFTPPNNQSDNPGEVIALKFRHPNWTIKEVLIVGIQFGRKDQEGEILRQQFDRETWAHSPSDYFSANICAANFDEAWRIMTIVGTLRSTQSINVSYGTPDIEYDVPKSGHRKQLKRNFRL